MNGGALALPFLVITLWLCALGVRTVDQDERIDQLQDTVKTQQTQLDQDRRQIAQLNGRVFLGVDVPDTESGVQK